MLLFYLQNHQLYKCLTQTNLLQLSCFKYILSCSCSSTLWLILHIFRECNYNCNSDSNLLKSYTVLLQNCATATMQKLWEVQPQGLVLVLHPGQVQLCNCNNLKVAESTNWNDTAFQFVFPATFELLQLDSLARDLCNCATFK